MHDIARRAIEGVEPIAKLVEDFYGAGGPLLEAGWEIRESQREMSLRFARQIDGASDPEVRSQSIGLIEAPTGTGKGQAYLVPGFLAALRAEARWSGGFITPSSHPAKLVVSTANIALQAQLIEKDIPALGRMLGVEPRATLMKSRQNYVCEEKILIEAGQSQFPSQATDRIRDVYDWSRRPSATGDKEHYPGDVSDIWHRVSTTSEECSGTLCPHYAEEGGARLCFWRRAVQSWPMAHIIVGNHHWVALSKGIVAVGYAIDEGHELENALRSVQGRTFNESNLISLGKRAARLIGANPERMESDLQAIGQRLFRSIEDMIDRATNHCSERDIKYRTPVVLQPGWGADAYPRSEHAVGDFKRLIALREEVTRSALAMQGNRFRDRLIVTTAKDLTPEQTRESKKAAALANRTAEVCRLFAATVVGRAHPDWPSYKAPWAIWGHREQDQTGIWRVVVQLVPADVAPAFSGLFEKYSTMLLASATLPEFSSMRLSLGLGATDQQQDQPPWPSAFNTNSGRWGTGSRSRDPEPVDEDQDEDGEPVSKFMRTPADLAPEPTYERRLPSPYPLSDMGVLLVPQGPSPKDQNWPDWAVEQVVKAVKLSRGGALVLATSNAAMRRYAEALRQIPGLTVYRQGETGRSKTIESFKSDRDSVLVGTRSFFQGLDVQGDSCRLVVIDKIPFSSPDDPLEGAVGRLLVDRALAMNPKTNGANAWTLRAIPEAAMVLVQGIGRLIRSQSDRGAVLLLDNRILYSGGGWATLRGALPPFPLSRTLTDIRRVLDNQPLQGVAKPPPSRCSVELHF